MNISKGILITCSILFILSYFNLKYVKINSEAHYNLVNRITDQINKEGYFCSATIDNNQIIFGDGPFILFDNKIILIGWYQKDYYALCSIVKKISTIYLYGWNYQLKNFLFDDQTIIIEQN